MSQFAVVVDESLAAYKFSDTHPLNPVRVMNAYRLAADVIANPAVEILKATAPVGLAELQKVHTFDYISAILAASNGELRSGFGLGSMDVPIFPGMHEAAARVCSATLTAAQRVATGDVIHAVNIGGGLHHAMANRAAGFCVYNDIAVAISWLLENGYDRIAYIDIDAHHGDGVQSIFYNDPRVLTFSIHESGNSLFPGTGFANETGFEAGDGYSVNVPLPAGTGDADWLRAIDGVLPELLAEFQPQIIFSQHGCDSHVRDPLTNLQISLDAQKTAHEMIHKYAHVYAAGAWIAVGGGGYDLHEVVPKTWTNLLAIATHQPELAVYSDGAAGTFSSFHAGFDPAAEIDRIILQTRKAVYPHFGLISNPHAVF
jgi:acetoin utilization protein AcuC